MIFKYCLQRSYHCQNASTKSAAVTPLSDSFLEVSWVRVRPSWSSADSLTVRMLSKMVKELQQLLHQMPHVMTRSFIILVISLGTHLANFLESFRPLWIVAWAISVDRQWAWSSFLTVAHQTFFSGNCGDRSLCVEVPLVHHCQFSLLCLFDNSLHLSSLRYLVAIDLLENVLNFWSFFWLWRVSTSKWSYQIIDQHCDRTWQGVKGERLTADQLEPIRWQVEGKGRKKTVCK